MSCFSRKNSTFSIPVRFLLSSREARSPFPIPLPLAFHRECEMCGTLRNSFSASILIFAEHQLCNSQKKILQCCTSLRGAGETNDRGEFTTGWAVASPREKWSPSQTEGPPRPWHAAQPVRPMAPQKAALASPYRTTLITSAWGVSNLAVSGCDI